MAIDSFGVSAQDVLDRYPGFDTSRVQQSDGPVSKDDVEEYIDEGASVVAGKLERFGLDAADLSDEAEKQAQIAVREYATKRALADNGSFGDAYEAMDDAYESALDDLRDRSEIDKPNSAYDSDIPSGSDHHKSPWAGQSWKM